MEKKHGRTNQKAKDESKQPFVSQEDRPEVRLSPDTPLSDLRVRELAAILSIVAGKSPHFEVGDSPLKDFFDKDDKESVKVKETKYETKEHKDKDKELRYEVKQHKDVKEVKMEKPEIKEKNEKLEHLEKKIEMGEAIFEPRTLREPDPRIEQLILMVTGLTTEVSQLSNQVADLRKDQKR